MIKSILMILAILPVFLFGVTGLASADTTKCSIQKGINLAANGQNSCDQSTKPGSIDKLISSILNILSLLVGAIAVIMIIVGGFRYVTSAGNESAVGEAKKTITYAIVGLIIVAVAQVIVHVVLNAVATAS